MTQPGDVLQGLIRYISAGEVELAEIFHGSKAAKRFYPCVVEVERGNSSRIYVDQVIIIDCGTGQSNLGNLRIPGQNFQLLRIQKLTSLNIQFRRMFAQLPFDYAYGPSLLITVV